MSDFIDSAYPDIELEYVDAMKLSGKMAAVLVEYEKKLSLNQMFAALDLTKALLTRVPLKKLL